MRPRARDKVLAAADKTAVAVGAKSFDDGVDQVCRIFEKLLETLNTMRTRDALIETLDNLEASPREEKLFIATMKMLPMLLRFAFQRLASHAQEFPAPPSGRPPVPVETQIDVINFVAGLHTKGTELGSAKYRASQKFGLGFRTIERVWNGRGELLENGPDPHFNDVVRLLET